MKYRYEGYDDQGEQHKGEIDASSEHDALRQLQQKHILVVEISAELAAAKPRWFSPKLTRAQLTQALQEMSTLINSGVSISDAIEAMVDGGHHPKLDAAFVKLSRSLQHGSSFSDALASCGLTLPDYFLHLARAGELSGQLGDSLGRALAKMEYDNRTANELRNSLTYPAILVFAGVAAVLLMFTVVVPKFSGMLGNSKAQLPWLAEVVLTTGQWFNANWHLLLAGMVIVLVPVLMLLKKPAMRQKLMNSASRLPLLGQWLYETDIASWSYTLSAMLSSKVDMLVALNLSGSSMRTPRRQRAMQEVIRQVRAGKSLSEGLLETRMLARAGVNLVRVGERTGRVDEMLGSLARMYEENGRNRMKKLLALIEPLAVLIIGGVIGVIILGIILAITSVNEIAI